MNSVLFSSKRNLGTCLDLGLSVQRLHMSSLFRQSSHGWVAFPPLPLKLSDHTPARLLFPRPPQRDLVRSKTSPSQYDFLLHLKA